MSYLIIVICERENFELDLTFPACCYWMRTCGVVQEQMSETLGRLLRREQFDVSIDKQPELICIAVKHLVLELAASG